MSRCGVCGGRIPPPAQWGQPGETAGYCRGSAHPHGICGAFDPDPDAYDVLEDPDRCERCNGTGIVQSGFSEGECCPSCDVDPIESTPYRPGEYPSTGD